MIKMIKERLMVQVVNRADGSSAGGVLLASGGAVNEGHGTVIAIGPLVENVSVGDTVIYIKSTAVPVRIAGVEHHVFDAPSILYIDS